MSLVGYRVRILAAAALATQLGACSLLEGLRLWTPETMGMEPAGPGLYVEAGIPREERPKLLDDIRWARNAIQQAYGEVRSSPVIYACGTEDCYSAFGGRSSVAKTYGNRILLSPRGLNRHFIAHEWSHAELHERLSMSGYFRVPAWFDEGLAVAISEAPEHSESHWQSLVRGDVPRPSREELMALETRAQWIDGVRRYGARLNGERKARGEHRVAPLYAAAGHEVRPWIAKAGTRGLLRLIDLVNGGGAFNTAYRAAATGTATGI